MWYRLYTGTNYCDHILHLQITCMCSHARLHHLSLSNGSIGMKHVYQLEHSLVISQHQKCTLMLKIFTMLYQNHSVETDILESVTTRITNTLNDVCVRAHVRDNALDSINYNIQSKPKHCSA